MSYKIVAGIFGQTIARADTAEAFQKACADKIADPSSPYAVVEFVDGPGGCRIVSSLIWTKKGWF